MWKFLILVCLIASAALADETVVLTGPTPTPVSVVASLRLCHLHWDTNADGTSASLFVSLCALDNLGRCYRNQAGSCTEVSESFEAGQATAIFNILNTANLSANSLTKRVIQKMQADGSLGAGTISGTPGVPALPTPLSTATPG